MYGYIFEVTNNKTGDTYLGKRYAVSFDKNYFGEADNAKLAVAIEKYGRPTFSVKMLMPFDTQEAIDAVFAEMDKSAKKVVVRATPDKVDDSKMEVVEEKPVEVVDEPKEEVKPKKGRKKKAE